VNTLDIRKRGFSLAEAIRAAKDGPVVLTERGRPLVVLQDVEGNDLESISLSLNPKFLELIMRSRIRTETEGGISHEEMVRRLAEVPPPDINGTTTTRRKARTKRV
jgi:prevent-host-death family protein